MTLGGAWWLGALARRSGPGFAPRLARLVLARRVWITAAAVLMLGMWGLMHIGLFHPVMLAALIPFFDGREVGAFVDRLAGDVRGQRPPGPRIARWRTRPRFVGRWAS